MSVTDRRELLLEAGLALSSELSLPIVLQRIVELAAELTHARYGALGVLGPDGQISDFITTGLTEAQRARIGPPPKGAGILGVLIHDATPLRLADIATDPRSVGFPAHHPPMRSFMGAPVKALGRIFGNIYLTEKRTAPEFSDDDMENLLVLATQAGVAIANASLYQEAQSARRDAERLAVMEDRERIARDMHDGIIQSLFAVGMRLQAMELRGGDAALGDAVAEIDRVILDLRNYIFGLRPGLLADRQLAGAIQALADDFSRRTAIPARVDVDAEVAQALTGRSADVVQMVTEALSNVARHAEARGVRVVLARERARAVLTVVDDGRGFDPEAPRGGQGLGNLDDRARRLGGRLSVRSRPGRGTRVRVSIPLPQGTATAR